MLQSYQEACKQVYQEAFQEAFQEEGAWVEPGLLAESEIARLERGLIGLVQQAAARLDREHGINIGLDELPREEILHAGVIRLYEAETVGSSVRAQCSLEPESSASASSATWVGKAMARMLIADYAHRQEWFVLR